MITTINVAMAISIMMKEVPAVMSLASSEKAQVEESILATSMAIEPVQAANNSDQVIFTLQNNGLTKLWSFDKFDVIVTYDANVTGSKVRLTEKLGYAGITNNVPNGDWGITQFVDDLLEPQILNPSEKLTIKCNLQNAVYPGGTVSVILSADNGKTASRSVVAS